MGVEQMAINKGKWGAGRGLGLVTIVFAALMVFWGCKQEYKHLAEQGQGEAAVEAPVEAAKPADAAKPVEAAKPAGEVGQAAAAETPEEPAEPKYKPTWHPAVNERPYKFLAGDEVATNAEEEEFVTLMSRAKDAQRAYKVIKTKPAAYLPFLHRAMRHPNREVRIQAIVMVGLLKDTSEVTEQALIDSLLLDRDPDIRASAAKDFVVLKSKNAVDALIRSLKEDPYEAARSNAAWALGAIGDKAAVQPLIEALKDEDTFVRLRATSALLKMKPMEAVPYLVDCLDDKSPMVQERALEALRKITKKNLGKSSDRWRKAYPQK
jgi:hypothetical protein